MKFDIEICKGIRCPECPFNKGEDGCLLAKRLDEIEIIPESCEDAVPRTSVEYICRKNTVSTNPYEHKYHDKFIQFMDDPDISDFGRWQHSNGFNTALVAVKCDLDRVPSVQPEQRWIPCSERLPKEYGNYLITTHNGDVDVGTINPKKKGVWSACDADGFYWIREVVAWMPLPEPPKEDDHETD